MKTRRTGCGRYVRSFSFGRQFVQPPVAAVRLDVLEGLAVDPRRAVVGTAAQVGELQDVLVGTPCRTAGRTDSRAIPSLWHAAPSGVSEPSVEVRGSSPISRLSCPFGTLVLNSGPFPRPALPGVLGTTGLSATPGGPACPSRASGWRSRAPHRLGLPVLRRVSSVGHAVANTPVGPLGRIARGTAYSNRFPVPQRRRPSPYQWRVGSHITAFRGLLGVHSRYGLPDSRRRRAALCHRRLRRLRYLHRRSDCFRLERPSCRVGLAPAEDPRLFTAHTEYPLSAAVH